MGFFEGGFANEVMEGGGAISEEQAFVTEEEIEFAVFGDAGGNGAQGGEESGDSGHGAWPAAYEGIEDGAEGAFAVSVAGGEKAAGEAGMEGMKGAVVGEEPVMAPEFTDEGVGIFESDAAVGGFADMSDGVSGFDRIGFEESGDGRGDGGSGVEEEAAAALLKEADAPAVGMISGVAAALAEAGEGEDNVGRDIAVHAKQFAHGESIAKGRGKRKAEWEGSG